MKHYSDIHACKQFLKFNSERKEEFNAAFFQKVIRKLVIISVEVCRFPRGKIMVKVSYLEDKSFVLAALGVKISQSSFDKSIEELYDECKADEEHSQRLVNTIMKKHEHFIISDFLPYALTLDEISRFAALYLWRNVSVYNLVFGAGIEASFRVIRPNKYCEVLGRIGKEAFQAYEKAVVTVPEQDARYMLPEGVLTRMIFSAPPRYLGKLACSLKNKPLNELKEIGEKLEFFVKDKFGMDVQESPPSDWSFWGERKIDEKISINYGGTPHTISLNMGVKGSLAMYAQLVRQRQLLCDIEPLESIARNSRFVVPPTFLKVIKEEYTEIARQAHAKQIELLERRDPSFVYFLLLGQEAGAMVYGKGYGVLETSKVRSEGVAQWEIRNHVGIPLTLKLAKYNELRGKIGPRCWREHRCIEPKTFKEKKSVCKAFLLAKGEWNKSLEELLGLLREPYETFEIKV
jgi:thymidylate synthase ThyX